eukprot:TRINITY_DN13985_c0_g1_i1.p1 TRINITY_DN13985_c0_g1~~TRINITY_DN13985_c0_g1_i1.p1  ORF type:complete len:347 (+),score=83.99 TRINITY_DN13985_c0_g1_i1:99-1139(+)
MPPLAAMRRAGTVDVLPGQYECIGGLQKTQSGTTVTAFDPVLKKRLEEQRAKLHRGGPAVQQLKCVASPSRNGRRSFLDGVADPGLAYHLSRQREKMADDLSDGDLTLKEHARKWERRRRSSGSSAAELGCRQLFQAELASEEPCLSPCRGVGRDRQRRAPLPLAEGTMALDQAISSSAPPSLTSSFEGDREAQPTSPISEPCSARSMPPSYSLCQCEASLETPDDALPGAAAADEASPGDLPLPSRRQCDSMAGSDTAEAAGDPMEMLSRALRESEVERRERFESRIQVLQAVIEQQRLSSEQLTASQLAEVVNLGEVNDSLSELEHSQRLLLAEAPPQALATGF